MHIEHIDTKNLLLRPEAHRCSSRSMARRKPMFSSTLAPRAKVHPNAAHSCLAISCTR